jgi:hypothetical protein
MVFGDGVGGYRVLEVLGKILEKVENSCHFERGTRRNLIHKIDYSHKISPSS